MFIILHMLTTMAYYYIMIIIILYYTTFIFFFSHRSPPRSRALTSPAHSHITPGQLPIVRYSRSPAFGRSVRQFFSIRARSHALTHVLVCLYINKYKIRVYNKRRHRCCCWDVVYLSRVCACECGVVCAQRK